VTATTIGLPVVALCSWISGCGFGAKATGASPGTGGSTTTSTSAGGSSSGLGGAAGRPPTVTTTSGAGGAGLPQPPSFTDFPAAPVIDPSAPANAQALFDGTARRSWGR
jgi:hypothetical protein